MFPDRIFGDSGVHPQIHGIDGSAEVGLFGGYTWKDPEEKRKQAGTSAWGLWDASNTHDGWTGEASIFGLYPVVRPVLLVSGTGLPHWSDDYTNSYFGVTPLDSLASGLSTYTAEGGIRDAHVWLTAALSMSKNIHFTAGVMYSWLLGDVTDSPIIKERKTSGSVVLGLSTPGKHP
jgi:outer membrane scaffolding protein for murein synthesis (MipA/OmpV family)